MPSNTPEVVPFVPTETWSVHMPFEDYDGPVRDAVLGVNRQGQIDLAARFLPTVQMTEEGIQYARHAGTNPGQYSRTDAIVIVDPFATPVNDNQRIRGELLRWAAHCAEVRDQQGDLLPVFMIGQFCLDGSMALDYTSEERETTRSGGFEVNLNRLLQPVVKEGYGSVHLAGHSMAGDVVASSLTAGYTAGLDVLSITAAEPIANKKRHKGYGVLLDFARAGFKALDESIERSGVDFQMEHKDGPREFLRWGRSALQKPNRDLYAAMGTDKTATTLGRLVAPDSLKRIVLGYGSKSRMTQPAVIEPILRDFDIDHPGLLTSVRIEDGNHTWPDQLTLYTQLILRAVA